MVMEEMKIRCGDSVLVPGDSRYSGGGVGGKATTVMGFAGAWSRLRVVKMVWMDVEVGGRGSRIGRPVVRSDCGVEGMWLVCF